MNNNYSISGLRIFLGHSDQRINNTGQVVIVHAFNPSTWEAEAGDLSEFKAGLVYKVGSRTVRTIAQKNHASKNKRQTKS